MTISNYFCRKGRRRRAFRPARRCRRKHPVPRPRTARPAALQKAAAMVPAFFSTSDIRLLAFSPPRAAGRKVGIGGQYLNGRADIWVTNLRISRPFFRMLAHLLQNGRARFLHAADLRRERRGRNAGVQHLQLLQIVPRLFPARRPAPPRPLRRGPPARAPSPRAGFFLSDRKYAPAATAHAPKKPGRLYTGSTAAHTRNAPAAMYSGSAERIFLFHHFFLPSSGLPCHSALCA